MYEFHGRWLPADAVVSGVENTLPVRSSYKSQMVVSLVLVWPLAVFATGKTSASSQLTPIVSSPAATPVVKQMGPSLPLSASLQTPTQSQQYAMPLTGVISARSVQSQYPVQQSVTGKNVQHKRRIASVTPSAEVGSVPQLSVADILAFRRAVQQSQLLSRSGVLAPSASGPISRSGLGYGTNGLLGQFGGAQFPGGSVTQFHDAYLASGSAPAGVHLPPSPAGNKNSISTRFRSFMNSLFFRRSTAASPAFYQGGPSPYGIPGATGASASPFSPPNGYHGGSAHAHGFSSKIYPGNAGAYSPQPSGGTYPAASGPVKSSIGSSPVTPKLTSYQTSASSLVSSIQKASILPMPATSVSSSPVSGASPVSRPSSSGGAFYPSAASAPGPSFDKTQFSSLYGTNGFTAKASPIGSSHPAKSSKSLKASSSSTMETPENQPSSFHSVAAPGQQQYQSLGAIKTTITPVSALDAVKTKNHHISDALGGAPTQIVTSSIQTSGHSVSHSLSSQSSSSSESSESTEQAVSK
ncbi:putative GPI-anchored protein pfl2 isoform X1 [Varroa destructor]|uniref:Uncharacterized protein n=1 Tax=Varroa destructor TaxID=109461 RepID=A0A7M7JJ64_VARDE|nr:putative GPI-anchored protein pfl2 isoform X1 [Varroa destructor]